MGVKGLKLQKRNLANKKPYYLSPFNSHEWPRQNFSLQYQDNVNQVSDKNKEKYQFGDNKWIKY